MLGCLRISDLTKILTNNRIDAELWDRESIYTCSNFSHNHHLKHTAPMSSTAIDRTPPHTQALIAKSTSAFTLPEAELNAYVDKLFAFSFVWSIAGSVQEEG